MEGSMFLIVDCKILFRLFLGDWGDLNKLRFVEYVLINVDLLNPSAVNKIGGSGIVGSFNIYCG